MFGRLRFFVVIAMLLIFSSCGVFSSSDERDTRYYEFTDSDEEATYSFMAKTSDPVLIQKAEQELQKPIAERNLHIHGDIARGDGGYNHNWSWHFIENEWDLVEISAEVCDGRPRMVEEDLDYWVDQVGYFCPWSSVVAGEVDVESGH